MLNKEKFKDVLIDFVLTGERVAMKDGVLCACERVRDCRECYFSNLNRRSGHNCKENRRNWLNSEYEEYVDWSKVPVDTKILVRDSESREWKPAHFAKFANGKVHAFFEGRTSFTGRGFAIPDWKYAKLYKEDEE